MPYRKIKNTQSEIKFLDGPQSRWADFKFTLKIVREFVKGFRVLHFTGPCVTIFGSARFEEDHPYYIQTRELAGKIAQLGFSIMTGGGPGIMEAANRGAKDVGGRSVGCNILLPFEQQGNPYLDKWVTIKYFFVRKTLMIKYSYAFVVMPGGFGTLDELFEALTLVQTEKIQDFPIIIFGKQYHQKLMDYVIHLKDKSAISPEDIDLISYTDDMEEVLNICKGVIEQHKLKYEYRPKYFPIFGEYKSN